MIEKILDPPTDHANYDSRITSETYIIDDQTQFWEISASYLKYKEIDYYWGHINANIASEIFQRIFQFREFSNTNISPTVRSILKLNVNEFFRFNAIVSLRFSMFSYVSGSAHPSEHLYTKNFLGPSAGVFDLKRILRSDHDALHSLKAQIITALKRQMPDSDPKKWIEDNYTTDEQLWNLVSKYNFNRSDLLIHLDAYDALAYTFGPQEVRIPWATLRNYLSREPTDEDLPDFLFAVSE